MWATILTLADLETNYIGTKEEWEMVAHKAHTWLESQNLKGQSLEEWIEEAKVYFDKEELIFPECVCRMGSSLMIGFFSGVW